MEFFLVENLKGYSVFNDKKTKGKFLSFISSQAEVVKS
jgi:hypothetical protein